MILQTTSRGLSVLAKADTIIIPGWRGTDAPVPTDLVRALRGAFARGARLISICSGVFVLAATGLLDGRQATTHWRYASTLRERYPKITVDPDILYTGDGMIFTSAGSAAGLDLCMHIIRKDYGVHIANAVARRLVIPPHREGGQVQFISSPIGEENIPWLSQLFAWIDANLERRITIDQLAGRAHMSLRTFSRKFQGATGTPPGDWLIGRRVQAAKGPLETTSDSIEVVAQRCGFSSAAIFRQHFAKRVRTTPRDYRRTFNITPPALPRIGVFLPAP